MGGNKQLQDMQWGKTVYDTPVDKLPLTYYSLSRVDIGGIYGCMDRCLGLFYILQLSRIMVEVRIDLTPHSS